MKVAVVHEWLVTWAGAERVLAEIMDLFPLADLFVLFDRLPESQRLNLPRDPVGESFLTYIPRIAHFYRNLLPIMPAAVESLNLSSYDLILSSSHSVGKGVRTHEGQLHLCYCHTPPRYLWDMTDAYFNASLSGRIKKAIASVFFPGLKRWDTKAAMRPDAFMANSGFVADRISRIYGRKSTIIYPPVDVERFSVKEKAGGDTFVTLGRLVPYKNIDRIAKAFQDSSHRLVIVGNGPGGRDLEDIIRGNPMIEWHRWITDEEWGQILRHTRAFLFMAEEDFGIAPVEAMAAGVPVIAWGKGGILESVKGLNLRDYDRSRGLETDGLTGLFYDEPTPKALKEAIDHFINLEDQFIPEEIRRNAERFSRKNFRDRYASFVHDQWSSHEDLSKRSVKDLSGRTRVVDKEDE